MDSPIFIVGNGRSGTTLLQLMLCAHPRIFVAFESNFYLFRATFPRNMAPADFLEQSFHNPSFRWLGVDPGRVRARLPDPLPPDRLALAYDAVLREAAALRGRVRYGDKSPLNSQYLARLYQDFPDARVIYIVRDTR